ncbi:filamentous hemagglutinin N-terminal domain-containing protein [Dulcicalothrix desertica]|nr:filamentous hemagglutinin N-terminal domain-containing protein [Dulcicalothrix desertica]TWH62741.1 filamentous hemagglutinin family protein [Dulcicalothrix desertica PCC 7102]
MSSILVCRLRSHIFQLLSYCSQAAIILIGNFSSAQITPDTSLPYNSSVETINNSKVINGGTQAGSNLFHSFEEFSIPLGVNAYFNNKLDIQNIITRVTGSKISNIDGIISANGAANLFFINPNGILIGNHAELNIGGSFIASTASSLNFADGNQFSATSSNPQQLLTVNLPIGLQFGTTANPIHLASQASPDNATNSLGFPVGLQVPHGKTLALIGGDIMLSGGNLTAVSGQIELLSVGSDSKVSLQPTPLGWVFGTAYVENFQDIKLMSRSGIRSVVDASGSGSGNINVQGKRVLLTGASTVRNITQGSFAGGNVTVQATESVELIGHKTSLSTGTESALKAGDLTITAKNLVIKDGAQVVSYSDGSGSGGRLTVNADNSVEIINGHSFIFPGKNINVFAPSAVLSIAFSIGNAGEIKVNTGRLYIQDGARISTESQGQYSPANNQFIPATGQGGNLIVNARDSIEVAGVGKNISEVSGLFTLTKGSGNAGNLKLNTGQLIVRDGGIVNVSSQVDKNFIYSSNDINNLGSSGSLEVSSNEIILDNQGKLIAETDSGKGGNIALQAWDLLLMRRGSQISTSAGKAQAIGDGGNITINIPTGFIVAPLRENNDITANAFSGSGGKVQINAISLFGTAPLSQEDLARQLGVNNTNSSLLDPSRLPTSDITAISQQNPTLNGAVNINTLDDSTNRIPINLPRKLVNQRIAQSCPKAVARGESQFVVTGRGGIPTSPQDLIRSNTIIEPNWVSIKRSNSRNEQDFTLHSVRSINVNSKQSYSEKIVEAQSWMRSHNGDVYLVESAPNSATNTLRHSGECS